MNDNDPILDAALDETLGGKSPPDLVARTLARSRVETQPAVRPRPLWRAWGTGLAAAALLTVTVLVLNVSKQPAPENHGEHVASTATDQSHSGEPGSMDTPTVAAEPRSTEWIHVDRVHVSGVPGNDSIHSLLAVVPANAGGGFNFKDLLRGGRPDQTGNASGFKGHGSNPFVDTSKERLSTFALEHDSASYTVARNFLRSGQLPPAAAIRPEEFINYFNYRYDPPTSAPFTIQMDAAPSRYGRNIGQGVLLRVGVQTRVIDPNHRKPAVLTIVVDTSGSMSGEHRIGLVRQAMETLVSQLREGDKVGIVAFGTEASVVLEHRDAGSKDAILAAVNELHANGSTNAAAGLALGYQMATAAYRENHTNRVVLCSDGVANTGVSDVQGLVNIIIENRRKGITLSSLGFGVGHMNDHLLEQLGNKGDGLYAYIDSLDEAKRMFVDNLTGALEVVGRDTKMQLDFNPRVVKSYRLIGYVNRALLSEHFRDDTVDGGEIGAGHSATALYELTLHEGAQGTLATATVRYKTDEEARASEIQREVGTQEIAPNWESASNEFRLAGNVAEFAEILGRSEHAGGYATLAEVLADLESMRFGSNPQVAELVELVKKAIELSR